MSAHTRAVLAVRHAERSGTLADFTEKVLGAVFELDDERYLNVPADQAYYCLDMEILRLAEIAESP